MKNGLTIQALATEVQRQMETRKDFIASAGMLKMRAAVFPNVPESIVLDGLNGSAVKLRPLMHEQLGGNLGIPKAYYDRMLKEQPKLLASNVNTWLEAKGTEKHLVRTLDGDGRAWLSNRYRPLDNADLLGAALPTLEKAGCTIVSSEITERRLYLKAILPSMEARVAGVRYGEGRTAAGKTQGARVAAAIVISNSEVGSGSLRIEPGVYEFSCTNLAIASTRMMRKYHIGRGLGDEGDSVEEFLKDETRAARDRAFWLTVRDTVAGAFDPMAFNSMVQLMEQAAGRQIEGEIPAVVEVTGDRFGLPEEARKGILKHLIERGELSQFGLSAAITRTAADVDSYDLSTEMERVGMQVVELPQAEWMKLAQVTSN